MLNPRRRYYVVYSPEQLLEEPTDLPVLDGLTRHQAEQLVLNLSSWAKDDYLALRHNYWWEVKISRIKRLTSTR